MKCMFCGHTESKVLDRRRRECLQCGRRFTTYEMIETTPILVVKNDGTRQQFDASKLKNGIVRSCEKRPVAMHDIDALVMSVEKQISNSLVQEISSRQIGEMVMKGLKDLDEIAYIRFASVYRQFRDVSALTDFIKDEKMNTKNKR